jgi:predicted metalloprotease with PDZ domain
MKYKIDTGEPHKHLLKLVFNFEIKNNSDRILQLPAWRPGRYELANYAKNILTFEAYNDKDKPISFKKTTKDQWLLGEEANGQVTIKYSYYAQQMDAGGSWLDEHQVYINFINCLFYIPGRTSEPCSVELMIPDNYTIACGLQSKGHVLFAESYAQLADSPMIASNNLAHEVITVNEIPFHIWINGNCKPDWSKLIKDFTAFIKIQIETMGSFPEKDYHFLFQILPYRHYHGVEHANSTVITLGPDTHINNKEMYSNLLGISSHELFHAWNICKIRPAELLPYDLSKENYFTTGYIAEGVTTYYGDLFLARAGVYSEKEYFDEVNDLLKRYYHNYGRHNLSVVDSSFDLWIDGYVPGIPNRKVSIYDKGAVIAFLTDLYIRSLTGHTRSLDDVLRALWNDYGQKGKGYSGENYQDIVEHITGKSAKDFFDKYVYGTEAQETDLNRYLQEIGCILTESLPDELLQKDYGLKLVFREGKYIADALAPDSPAELYIEKDDELVTIDNIRIDNNVKELIEGKEKVNLSVFRRNILKTFTLIKTEQNYFTYIRLEKFKDISNKQEAYFQKWIRN